MAIARISLNGSGRPWSFGRGSSAKRKYLADPVLMSIRTTPEPSVRFGIHPVQFRIGSEGYRPLIPLMSRIRNVYETSGAHTPNP